MVEFQLPKLATRVRFPFLAPYFIQLFRAAHRVRNILGFKVIRFAFLKNASDFRLFSGIQFLVIFGLLGFSAGCTTTEYVPAASITRKQGVYHKVQKGETVWRIAKVYRVSIDDIIRINNIPDAAHVEENQLVFVPGAKQVKNIVVAAEDKNKEEFAWPIKGKIVSYFGKRSIFFNNGIDIKAREGQLVRASRQGVVVFADYLSGHGYTVILDHSDGYLSVYSQNSKVLVGVGDLVFKEGSIAEAGKRRNLAFLHFEIRRKSKARNPLYYLPKL